MQIKFTSIVTLICAVVMLTALKAPAQENNQTDKKTITAKEAKEIAKEAYIYGFAIVENYKAIFGMCVFEKSPAYSGFNHFLHGRKLYDPDYTTVVSANNDTYYSTTWADLSRQPLVIKVPPTNDVYFSIQLVDMFTDNFAYIGTRSTGTNGGTFLLIGPDNSVSVPAGKFDRIITSKSRYAALATRTATDGSKEGNKKAFAIQDHLELIPLSKYLGTNAPESSVQVDFPPYKADLLYGKPKFFEYMNRFLEWQSPSQEEADLMKRFGKLNIGPYRTFDMNDFSPEVKTAIQEGIDAGHNEIVDKANSLGERVNGWEYTPPMGNYGQDYLFRSAVAYKFIYTHNPEEALYPIAEADGDNEELDASKHNYVLHFAANQLPPVEAFWSLTMYHSDSRLMVHNDIKRYSIGDRTKRIKFGADGSLTIYIQKENPGPDKAGNWLPAPDGQFYLIARMYIPKPEAVDGSYKLPAMSKE